MTNWLVVMGLVPMFLSAAETQWAWRDKGGIVHTREELNSILEEHRTWLLPRRAGSQVQLGHRADLSGAYLSGAYLSGSTLSDANLGGANLTKATLTGAYLRHADISNASLIGAKLHTAYLSNANLSNANLNEADLSDAFLFSADLGGANLGAADLSNATLSNANLNEARYEPAKHPDPHAIADAHGLGYITWFKNSAPIYALRKLLLEAGFRKAAREVNAAINRHNQSPLELVFFDWTCEWGANWPRPLGLVGALSLICTLVYWVGMRFGKRSGLYLAATGQRITTAKGKERVLRIRLRHPQHAVPSQVESGSQELPPATPVVSWRRELWLEFRSELRALGTAFLFSLMSVFNIGFREFNFGRWIRMLQTRDFDIRARGWMRTVSGVQSLIGVALVALSVLSYFGYPFWG